MSLLGRGPGLARWGGSIGTGPFAFGAQKQVGSRRPFREYVDQATRGVFEWHRHNLIAAEYIEAVRDRQIDRLLVIEPPRHGKTDQFSRHASGFWLEAYPDTWVGLGSYGANLAKGISRRARTYFKAAGNEVSTERAAAEEWETLHGGGMWAAGRDGAVTGKGASLGILDDLLKNRKEADSPTIRAEAVDFIQSTFYTRLTADGALIVTFTRWHMLDPIGWLMQQEELGETAEGWTVLDFPARYEGERDFWPVSCDVVPDFRTELGAALCPERYDEAALERIEKAVGPREWASLYQGRPRPRDGDFFRYEWIGDKRFAPPAPAAAEWVRYWDTAGSEEPTADRTVGALLARTHEGYFYVVDVVAGRWTPGERDRIIRATAEADGRHVRIGIEQESGINGKKRTQAMVRKLAGFNVFTEPATGSKEDRAEPLAAQWEVGNVRLCEFAGVDDYIDELLSFPNGEHDDRVDASSGAFNALAVPLAEVLTYGIEL